MAKFNVSQEFFDLDHGFDAITKMQWMAVGGSLRPDQAVAFILRSEKIRMSMVTQIMKLSHLIEQAEEGKIGH
jgi:hypothetical protein